MSSAEWEFNGFLKYLKPNKKKQSNCYRGQRLKEAQIWNLQLFYISGKNYFSSLKWQFYFENSGADFKDQVHCSFIVFKSKINTNFWEILNDVSSGE